MRRPSHPGSTSAVPPRLYCFSPACPRLFSPWLQESDYGHEDSDGSAYGSNGGFGASDYGHSGSNEDLDYTSSKAHGGDKKNQAGDKRRLIVGPLPFTAIWTGFYGPVRRIC